ncbi:MAG: nucleotidyltransferase domain-containing protein [Actinomycetota bacterium]|nr:nucleotidyltransferase domain-containing protein [Actinomycetota bacterium]
MTERDIAERELIIRALVGSTIHGLEVPGTDDRDEMGVCIEPPDYVAGLKRFETYVFRTKPEGIRSEAGDLDFVVHSLRKFARLALKGNPTVLLLLFVKPEQLILRTELGDELQALAPAFVSRQAGKAFLGYLTAQKERLLGARGQLRVKRPELVDEHGYDTKYAMHMLRLGLQGKELLETARISLPMREPDRRRVFAVRRGEVPFNDVLKEIAELERDLNDLLETSFLPPDPDRATVDEFLVSAHLRHWGID